MFTILICSCDKFSDLWHEHVRLLHKHWIGKLCRAVLVTDKDTDAILKDVDIIVAPSDYDFSKRIAYALDFIETEYVLLTLDDYFLIYDTYLENITKLLEISITRDIDYLLLYNRRRKNTPKCVDLEKIEQIDLEKKYAVILYPALWKVSFLKKTVRDNISAWEYEFLLTETARIEKAQCFFSPSGSFEILDVVRKGKILHKADKYFNKNGIDIGSREKIGYFTVIKLEIMDRVSWYVPKWGQAWIKRLLRLFGMQFFSDIK